MNKKSTGSVMGLYFGSIALVLSALAVVPSSGPLTGAMYLILITIPLAFLAFYSGARRTATGALYFSICSFIVSPMTWDPGIRIDMLMAGLMILGVFIMGGMYWNYLKRPQT